MTSPEPSDSAPADDDSASLFVAIHRLRRRGLDVRSSHLTSTRWNTVVPRPLLNSRSRYDRDSRSRLKRAADLLD